MATDPADPIQISTSSMSYSATEDGSSPYFLHHSDSPGLILVSQQLTGENYILWSRAMFIALSVKNKVGFINGSITQPENKFELLNSWISNNNMVISWILNYVSKDISASIIYSESAHEIWTDLKERFQQWNGPRIFQLRRDLMNHTQGQMSVSVYFTKLKTVWEELSNYRPSCSCEKCTCEGNKKLMEHYHMEYVMSFLMGLNESYAQVRGQILLMDPIPPINKVFSLISQEEQQRELNLTAGTTDSLAFYAKTDNRKPTLGQSYNKNQKMDRPICTYCGYGGHAVDKCYKLHDYPPRYKANQRSNQSGYKSNAVTNQISDSFTGQSAGNAENFVQTLNPGQYKHLMNMLSTHLVAAKIGDEPTKSDNA